jgi:hypothetical protein
VQEKARLTATERLLNRRASIKHLTIGLALHIANCDKPVLREKEFYRLKSRLCHEYGERTGTDWQHIRKECRACKGTGIYDRPAVPRARYYYCNRCGGTGIYEEFWSELAIWMIGPFRFHEPIRQHFQRPGDLTRSDSPKVIEGYITHDYYPHRLGLEAWLWLLWFFARDRFRHELRHGSYSRLRYARTPLVALSIVTNGLSWAWMIEIRSFLRRWEWQVEQWRNFERLSWDELWIDEHGWDNLEDDDLPF